MTEEERTVNAERAEVTSEAQVEVPVESVPEAPKKKGMSSGLKRLITGVLLAGVMLVFLLVLRPICIHSFDVLAMFFVVAGGLEMRKALKTGGYNVMLAPQIVFFVVVYPLFLLLGTDGILIALAVSATVALAIFTFKHTYSLTDLGMSIFEIVYPSVFVAMIMAVNWYAGDLLALFILIAVPLASDAFAYFVGSKLGKHKLCPEISPKKSVEGLYGGIFGAILMGCIIMLLFDVFHLFDGVNNIKLPALSDHIGVSIALYSVLSVLVMLSGMVGDLVASWIKRKVGIKDYGKVFPGHGGVMDRMDSVIFSMPVVYVFFTIYNLVQNGGVVERISIITEILGA
ncbi:MAG: phosphatidate cytidylyltransferase [Clostridia bacterium]|nr:phosphatidate cytidylyltransferase [Clostridia bacterium]